jgi:hypothetical protein
MSNRLSLFQTKKKIKKSLKKHVHRQTTDLHPFFSDLPPPVKNVQFPQILKNSSKKERRHRSIRLPIVNPLGLCRMSMTAMTNPSIHGSPVKMGHRVDSPPRSSSLLMMDSLRAQEHDDLEAMLPSLLMSDGLSETSSDSSDSKHSLISALSDEVAQTQPPTPKKSGHKRKSLEPHRSIRGGGPSHHSKDARVIQFDIYSPFQSNPSFLLYASSSHGKTRERSASDVSHSFSPATLSSIKERPATAKRTFTPANRATKALPDFVVQGFAATTEDDWELDMSKYRDTKGAPPIQWRGKENFATIALLDVSSHTAMLGKLVRNHFSFLMTLLEEKT